MNIPQCRNLHCAGQKKSRPASAFRAENRAVMASAGEQQKLQTALSHHQNGNINEAAKLYRELIAANSRNSYALHFLGVIEAGVGQFDEAKSLIANSLSLQPGNVQFIENYASILFQMGDFKTALQMCEQGRQINPSNVTLS